MDEPKPPFLLCSLIALATVMGIGAVLISQNDQDDRAMTAAVSAQAKDLSQVLQLKKIYSEPPQPEEPQKYPKARPENESGPETEMDAQGRRPDEGQR